MAYKFDKSGKVLPPTAEEIAAGDAAGDYVVVRDQGVMKSGKHYWVYLQVKPSKYKAFMQAVKAKKPIKHKEYGTILKLGFGKEIPDDVKEEMAKKYNCDDDYMKNQKEKLKVARTAFDKKQEDKKLGDIVAMMKLQQMKKK
jgi:hypothetical protein